MTRNLAWFIPVGLLVMSGCSADLDSTEGNLGKGTFSFRCVDGSDPACATLAGGATNAEPTRAPQAYAVGSRFLVQYVASSADTAGNPLIRAVSSDYLQASDAASDLFTVEKAGKGGVYALSTVNSQLIDYTLVNLAIVDAIALASDTGVAVSENLPLQQDDDLVLTVQPTADGVPVGGALGFSWSTNPTGVLTETSADPTARATFHAAAKGTTTITVALGALHANVTAVVQ